MCAGNFFCDGREGFINFAIVLKFILAEYGDVVFSPIPLTDKLLAMIECIFVERLLNFTLYQPVQLVLRPNG